MTIALPPQSASTSSNLSPAERRALLLVAAAAFGFGSFGFLSGAPGTVPYLVTVGVGTAVVCRFRGRRPLPPWLVGGLALLPALHLAGGLVPVGGDVLYNASAGGQLWRYDHLVHSLATFLGTLTCWQLLPARGGGRSVPAVVWLLAGLGLGSVIETIEFATTMLHGAHHVGGYVNTGWDLVSNLGGALAASGVVRWRTPRS